MDKGQVIRYSNQELALIKSTFADNDELLTALYKFVLQLDMSEKEEVMVKGLGKGDISKVLRKSFLPDLNDDVPIEQRLDLLMTVKTEEMPTEDVWISGRARDIVIKYLDKTMKALEEDTSRPEMEELTKITSKTPDEYHVDLKARNTIINHTIQRIVELRALAGKKEETSEEQQKRLLQNSNK